MPLSKARDRERWHKRKLQPKLATLQPNFHPRYGEFSSIVEQVRALYPNGPNCPDGRYR